MKAILFWLGLAVVALACNVLIYQKEKILAEGRQLFLKLRPVDPRSFMQGDYMRLAYAIGDELKSHQLDEQGLLAVQLDAQGIGTKARKDDGQPLGADEVWLRYYNLRGLRLGAESFFFQEGQAKVYEQAHYAELRVSPSGESVLVGLRGENLKELVPPLDSR